MSLEHIKLSEQERDYLLKLKRSTGIKNWNVLCRWAFCTSLAEPSIPPQAKIPSNSAVEMTWKVFGGAHHDVYLALLKARCKRDGLGTSEDVLTTQFRLHLYRGIGYLFADKQIKNIRAFLQRLPLDEPSS
ncbi:MAG TPA: DNA sulfur modification protein DndE [Polyangium sp.]|nr:DNA sulfur modification protein DndE [Polyangium sp.]